MPIRPNPFHDLHHQTEREIARTRRATRDLEIYLRSAKLEHRAEEERIMEAGKRRGASAPRAH
jgi:hypothetical protein